MTIPKTEPRLSSELISFGLIIGLPIIKLYKLVTENFAYKFYSSVIPVVTTTFSTSHNANPNVVVAGLAEQLRAAEGVHI